tara:strand:- start:58106 stop:58237 length:132 start_codon:yes stop_codon:yes gene_type:complete
MGKFVSPAAQENIFASAQILLDFTGKAGFSHGNAYFHQVDHIA